MDGIVLDDLDKDDYHGADDVDDLDGACVVADADGVNDGLVLWPC